MNDGTTDGERAELHSLREHLDERVVDRMRALEYAANASMNYLYTGKLAAEGRANAGDLSMAYGIMVLALEKAGYSFELHATHGML